MGTGIAAVLRRMACTWRSALFGALLFAAALLIASDYVAMDDPQMLGHAVQIAALLLALRQRPLMAALLFAASLFIKHNLIALPLACGLWLLTQDRRGGTRFLLAGLGLGAAGLLAFRLAFGTGLAGELASPRLSSFANLRAAASQFLTWAGLPLAAMIALPRDRHGLFCLLYLGLALAMGVGFSAGDGVDANIFFDAVIALSLGLGLAVSRVPLLMLAALPLPAFLAWNFADNNFAYTGDFAAQSGRDIAFLKARPGPALCDQLSLCLWAGKGAVVDVFNVGQQIATGARDPAALARMIESRHFAVLQFESLDDFALGPRIRAAVLRQYRVDHNDDNGVFLVPR